MNPPAVTRDTHRDTPRDSRVSHGTPYPTRPDPTRPVYTAGSSLVVKGVQKQALHESVEANAMPDLRQLEALDWTPECQDGDCHAPATGIDALRCCNTNCLHCDDGHRKALQRPKEAADTYCEVCQLPIGPNDLDWRPL